MPAIALELPRRSFLAMLAAPVAALLADPPPEHIVALFSAMATALSESNPTAFLKPIDRNMKDYAKLEAYVRALTTQAEVSCSVEFLKDEGDEAKRVVMVDWFLQISSRQDSGPLERRRENVTCQLTHNKKSWTVMSLEPVELFRPPGAERATTAHSANTPPPAPRTPPA
jgi:hypothetical protein